jgi:uncharacterized membrane protein
MINATVRAAAILLGVGLGGLIEGIVLRQILQWHSMLSSALPPQTMEAMQKNLRADGWFSAGIWSVTLTGVLLLWQAAREGRALPSTRAFAGYLIFGWGWFNLAEGVVNHHVLGLHHVHDLPAYNEVYDWVYLLAGGVFLILFGFALRDGKRRGRLMAG